MNQIFATGLTGTIGRHLLKKVFSLDLNLASERKYFELLNFEKNSNLIHLAGVVGSSEVEKNLDYARSVNINGTGFLAREFLNKSDGIFYYVSTSHVYARTQHLITETSPVTPGNVYAKQKLEAERMLQKIFSSAPKRLSIVRVFSVLDWDVAPYTLGGAIKRMIDSDFVLSNASDIRDFLTPKTIAEVIYEIALTGAQFEIVNLCSGSGILVGEAAKKMLHESGFEVDDNRFSWQQSLNPYVVGNNSQLLSRFPLLNLSWQPSILN